MLKLIENEALAGTIDGANTIFKTSWYISHIQDVVVDGAPVTAYGFEYDTITLEVAPLMSITSSFFMREERDVAWDGITTMLDVVNDIYDEIGRTNSSKIYPKDRLIKEVNKTIGVLFDEIHWRDRMQHYWFKGINWIKVSIEDHTVDLEKSDTYSLPIEGSFYVWKWIYYNYFDYDNGVFTVSWTDLIEAYDKINVWHRIPYGVSKISEVYMNGVKLEYIDNRDFYMDCTDVFTTVRDYQWNTYLYLPYSANEYSCVVKYIPDATIKSNDDDIIDIEYKYTRVLVYDVSYRILASREDERWKYYKKELNEMKALYKWYKARATKKTRSVIWIAPIIDYRWAKQMADILPAWVYDDYIN